LNGRICYFGAMSMSAGYSCCLRFIILVIPLFLVIVGIKVPDLSRPHEPKPMRRAVLDKTPARSAQLSTVKIDADPLITHHPAFVFASSDEYSPEAEPLHSSVPLLPLNTPSPRAPPQANPSARTAPLHQESLIPG